MSETTPPPLSDPYQKLTLRQALFLKEYIKDENGRRAAVAAGYSEKGASTTASRLLKEESVQEALSIIKSKIVESGVYDVEAALKQIEDNINEAREKNQYSAVAKMIELKTKIAGIYQEKMVMDVKASKGNFIMVMPALAPPPYAEETKQLRDVTPQELIENAKSQKK